MISKNVAKHMRSRNYYVKHSKKKGDKLSQALYEDLYLNIWKISQNRQVEESFILSASAIMESYVVNDAPRLVSIWTNLTRF